MLGRRFVCPIGPATQREFILDWRIFRYNSQHALSFGSAVQTCKFKKKNIYIYKIKQYIYNIILSLLLIWNRCFSWTLTAQPAQIWKFVSIAESFYSVRYGSSNIMSFIPLNNLFCFMSFKMFFEQSAIFTRVERPCYKKKTPQDFDRKTLIVIKKLPSPSEAPWKKLKVFVISSFTGSMK